MRPRRPAVLVLLALAPLAAGCLKRSKVARTYVLDSVVAAGVELAGAPLAVVGVERVRVPDWLDRPQISGRAPGGEVTVDEFSRWGEPLPRGLQRVLAENLAQLLPERTVVWAPFSPRDTVDHFVEVVFLDASSQADGSALLECRWTVLAKDGSVVARGRSSHRASPSATGPPGAVAGLNEALAGLSRELADVLRAQPAVPRAQPAVQEGKP